MAITVTFMSDAIYESEVCLYQLQGGCGVPCGAYAAVHEERAIIEEYGQDPTYIPTSSDSGKAFNRTSRGEILKRPADHAPSFIGLAYAF